MRTKILKTSLFIILVMLWANAALGLPSDLNATISPSEIQFQVIDPSGNVTGYDPATGTIVNNIPNTHYFMDQEPTGPVEPTKYQKFMVIRPTLISSATAVAIGIYTIKIFGSVIPEPFGFTFAVFYHGYRGPQAVGLIRGVTITPNTTLTYQMTVPAVPPPGGIMPMTLIASSTSVPALPPQAPPASGGAGVQNPPAPPQNPATPGTGNGGDQIKTNDELRATALIDHIKANGQAGLIGGPEYVDELVKKVNEIEKEITESHERHENYARKVVEKYQKLLKEITEKYNKPEKDEFVKQAAYMMLKADLDYIIGQIQ